MVRAWNGRRVAAKWLGTVVCALYATFFGAGEAASAGPGGSPGARGATADYVRLASWFEGTFSNAAQAAGDPAFQERGLWTVAIWPGRTEARWFYVEQAARGHERKPERQRIYRLTLSSDGTIATAVLTLPHPERYVGAWADTSKLSRLTPADLGAGEGCMVYLRKRGDTFAGGTDGTRCASAAGGAKYATSEMEVSPGGIRILERGYDARGKQVWGSTRGAYDFRRP